MRTLGRRRTRGDRGAPEAADAGDSPFPPQQYLNVYRWAPDPGEWRRVLDATEFTVNGQPLLATGEPTGQAVDFLEFVDFDGDGVAKLAIGVQHSGATAGPLLVLILEGAANPDVVFEQSTMRGGTLTVGENERTLIVETGAYDEDDPLCCPSRRSTSVIGHNTSTGEIEVIEHTERPADR